MPWFVSVVPACSFSVFVGCLVRVYVYKCSLMCTTVHTSLTFNNYLPGVLARNDKLEGFFYGLMCTLVNLINAVRVKDGGQTTAQAGRNPGGTDECRPGAGGYGAAFCQPGYPGGDSSGGGGAYIILSPLPEHGRSGPAAGGRAGAGVTPDDA